MLGRAAYQQPASLLEVDARVFGAPAPSPSREAAVEAHMNYLERKLAEGVPLHAMTRHMLGLFNARPGGRLWRRVLSERGVRAGAGVEVVREGLAHVTNAAALAA
jgi:tRNA-dihydrouridine synthase A